MEEQFTAIGVPGYDELVAGRIPKGSSILVSGGPGTGKTTFCLQTLAYGASQGEKCLYLSFEESKDRLFRNLRTFGKDPEALSKAGLLRIEKLDPFRMSRSVETLLAQARGELLIDINAASELIPKDYAPDRIVLDSLSAVAAAFWGGNEAYRAYISQLFDTFRKAGATSFLITEVEQKANRYSRSGVEEFLSDGVFVFYNLRQKNQRLSATEIIKLRGVQHMKRLAPFKMIPSKGIVVYPQEDVFLDE